MTRRWGAYGGQGSAYFGASVASAGDVNGDGYGDVVVGAYLFTHGQFEEGRAMAYYGSPAGLSKAVDWNYESNQHQAFFGASVASAGDVNGDGYDDVVIGAPTYSNDQTEEGRAFLFYGSASGLSVDPDWTAESDQSLAYYGSSVASAGDVNGDGYSDVIVGAPGYGNDQGEGGAAFIYYGSVSGLPTTPSWTTGVGQYQAGFGSSLGSAGDVNGDGFDDVIVGALFYDHGQTDEGGSFVYDGSASGPSTSANWTAESNQAFAYFGVSVASAGDVNGDGFADVMAGAEYYDNGQTDEGRGFAYYGSPSGLSTVPNWIAESDQASALFGVSVASAGDVNGDGFSDVIVGAEQYDHGQTDEGRSYLYRGSTTGLLSIPSWIAESQQDFALFGWSVASAGDSDGNGYDDILVGAPAYDRGESDVGAAFGYFGG